MMSRLTIIIVLCLFPAAGGAQENPSQAFVDAFKSKDARARLAALAALANSGEAGDHADAVAALIKDGSPQVRRAALQVYGGLTLEPAKMAPILAAGLTDTNTVNRYVAARALIDLGEPAIPFFVALLDEKETSFRVLAVLALEQLASAHTEAGKALNLGLKDSQTIVRRLAVVALARLGDPEVSITESLGQCLTDKDTPTRLIAAQTLLSLDKAKALPFLVQAIKDASVGVRQTATQGLASLGEDLDEAGVLALRDALADADAKVRQAAAAGLSQAGSKARDLGEDTKLAQALFHMLQDKDVVCRQAAVLALGNIGLNDTDELKLLGAALQDRDARVRIQTVQALSQYSHEEAPEDWRAYIIERVFQSLKDRDMRVRLAAAQVLLEEDKKLVLPRLTELVEVGTGSPRLMAAYLLGEMGPEAAAAIPALQKMGRASAAEYRQAASQALEKIGMP